MVVPGRNPVLLAKSIASLDRISGGRVLPAFGLGAVNLAEHQAFGVERSRAGAVVRRGPAVAASSVERGRRRSPRRAVLARGRAGATQARAGPPRGVARRHRAIGAAPHRSPRRRLAAELLHRRRRRRGHPGHRRRERRRPSRPPIDREHFGAFIGYTTDGIIPDRIRQAVEARRPGLDPAAIMVAGRVRSHRRASRSSSMPAPASSWWRRSPNPTTGPHELAALADEVLHFHG